MKNSLLLAHLFPLWSYAQVSSPDTMTSNSPTVQTTVQITAHNTLQSTAQTTVETTSPTDWYEWNADEANLDADFINDMEQKTDDLLDQIHPALSFENITPEQLQSLGLFNEFEVFNILQYRKEVRTLLTYYELLSIRGITMTHVNLLKSVLPLQSSNPSNGAHPWQKNKTRQYRPPLRWSFSSNFSSTFERPIGYLDASSPDNSGKKEAYKNTKIHSNTHEEEKTEINGLPAAFQSSDAHTPNIDANPVARNADNETSGNSPHYLGSPLRCTQRLKLFRPSRWTLSAILDKDPGETFGSFKGGYVHFQPHKIVDEFILGNFQWSAGQGLTLWSGAALRAAPDPRNSVRFARGIRPYGGASEQRYLRGVALSKNLSGKWTASAAYNYRQVDNPNPLSNSGLYSTTEDLEQRYLYHWQWLGLDVRTSLKNWIIGVVGHYSRVVENSTKSEIEAETRIGAHYLHQHKSVTVGGEITRTPRGWGTVHGLTLSTGGPIDLGLNFRFFSPDFQPSLNAPLARSGKYGERGIASVWEWRTKSGWNLNASVDFYGLYTSSYRLDLPHWNRRWLVRLLGPEYPWGKMQLVWGMKNMGEEVTSGYLPIQTRDSTHALQWKYQLPFMLPWNVSFQGRWSYSQGLWGRGYALSIKRTGRQFTLQLRYLFYDTPNFDTRIYLYEAAPRFQWSMPAFSGLGHRWYAHTSWNLATEKLRLRIGARLGRWVNWDGAYHGSNWNEIQSPSKTDWSLYVSLQQ